MPPIIDRLCKVDIVQLDNTLQFNRDNAFYQEIDSSRAELLPSVTDRHLVLTAETNTLIIHFDC